MPPKKIKGPRNGTLVAAFNGKARSNLSAASLSNSTVLILLSIKGNERCKGKYLQASLEHATANYGKTIVLIADKLHWNNRRGQHVDNAQKTTLEQQAVDAGSEYINNNLTYFLAILVQKIPGFSLEGFYADNQHTSITEQIAQINSIAASHNIPLQIVRWSDWLTPAFSAKQNDIMALFQSHPHLKSSALETAAIFVKRHKLEEAAPDDTELALCHDAGAREQLLLTRSFGFITEESARLYVVAAELNVNFVAYHGDITSVFQASRDVLIQQSGSVAVHPLAITVENKSNIANWLTIDFKRQPPAVASLPPLLSITIPSQLKKTKLSASDISAFMDQSTLTMQANNSIMFYYPTPPKITRAHTSKPIARPNSDQFFLSSTSYSTNRHLIFTRRKTAPHLHPIERPTSPCAISSMAVLQYLEHLPEAMQVKVLLSVINQLPCKHAIMNSELIIGGTGFST